MNAAIRGAPQGTTRQNKAYAIHDHDTAAGHLIA